MMPASNLSESKSCPICGDDLLLSFFGTCVARPDGKNLYCKKCINVKIKLARQQARDRKKRLKEVRQQRTPDPPLPVYVPVVRQHPELPADRILLELSGADWQTYSELLHSTRLPKDTLGDGLAQLLLWDRKIETRVDDGRRVYRTRKESNGK